MKEAARRAYQLFSSNPDHPSLIQEAARIRGRLVGADQRTYRAVGERDGDVIEWAWIGSHNEFDSKFG